eukprot:1106747-Amphidinium_carterae.1
MRNIGSTEDRKKSHGTSSEETQNFERRDTRKTTIKNLLPLLVLINSQRHNSCRNRWLLLLSPEILWKLLVHNTSINQFLVSAQSSSLEQKDSMGGIVREIQLTQKTITSNLPIFHN